MTYLVIAIVALYVMFGLTQFRKSFRVVIGDILPDGWFDLLFMLVLAFVYSLLWGFITIYVSFDRKLNLKPVSVAERIIGAPRDDQRKVTTLELERRASHEPDDLDVALAQDRARKRAEGNQVYQVGFPRGDVKKEGNPPF